MEKMDVSHIKYDLLDMDLGDSIGIERKSYCLVEVWNPPSCGFQPLNVRIFRREDGKYFRFAGLYDADFNIDPDNYLTEFSPKKISFLYFDEIGIKKDEVEDLINKHFLCPTLEINLTKDSQ